ncbi:MAG: thioredoxin domain-containing protein, partial [Abditibacteriaceae bacterium]
MSNQLIHSQNPYLRQHAENPVDWMQWGEEAFAKAREEDKPIFLSIGYSTCHWCHVMAHESFEQPQIAAYLNEHFVSIKVDREERPDVDHLYMSFVQATTGSGGWPLTVFLTPDLKPFFGGTYFPPVEVQGHVAFPTLLGKLAAAWKNQRDRIEESGNEVIKALTEFTTLTKSTFQEASWDSYAKKCFEDLGNAYDPEYGGFGGAPLFPRPVTHDFLHQYYAIHKDETALEMSARTLSKMAAGGMHDQLGGGFHRYSVDHYWIVPHFEKMLYDQAQLAISFLEMYQLSDDDFYAETARDIFDYVLRDLRYPQGGFFAAEDADSLDAPGSEHAHEGLFYIWAQEEIKAALGEESLLFMRRYDVRPNGNAPAEGDPAGEFKDTNILHIAQSIETLSKAFKLDEDKVEEAL